MAYIRESESALHEGLEDMYEKMGDVTLRYERERLASTTDVQEGIFEIRFKICIWVGGVSTKSGGVSS